VVGGSQLFVEDARKALQCFSEPCALYNEYGPTEATVGCVVHRFDPSDGAAGGGVVPIGGPIAGMRLVLRHAPGAGEGVRELLLSGDGVASGYTSAGDEANAAFERLPGGTLAYRTGDMVRVLASGELAFWGRRGDALKVNGYRVDRPELVEALRALPGVADAHVVVASAGGADTLTAYVTCRDEAPVAELRPLLLGQLPPYMVPHRFLQVPAIPLTANGKVDEAALGQLPHAVLGRPRAAAPLSGAEQCVAEVWRQVLGLPDEPLGAQAHFFELGGDSLAFLRMLTAVEAFLDGEQGRAALAARLRELLEDPTLGRLAAIVEGLAPGLGAARATEGQRG